MSIFISPPSRNEFCDTRCVEINPFRYTCAPTRNKTVRDQNQMMWYLAVFTFILLSSGCGTTDPAIIKDGSQSAGTSAPPMPNTISGIAVQAEARGDFPEAAREYNRLAESSKSPLKEDYQLRAAEVLIRGNFMDEGRRIIDIMALKTLPPTLAIRQQLAFARIALIQQDPEQALLELPDNVTDSRSNTVNIEFYQLRADAYTQTNATLEALRDLITLEPMLSDQNAIRENQNTIWQLLTDSSLETIRQLRDESSDDILNGWLDLGEYAKTYQLPSVQLDREVTSWRSRYPVHPATEELLQSLIALQQDLTYQPTRIALLIPHSGPYSKPANAIREGFFAGYYTRQDTSYTPTIKIYDTGELADQAVQAYENAVADGAEIIIGPLNKESVNTLARSESLDIPTLTLNYSSVTENLPKNLYQIGLAPEDEARQAAERAWLDGYNQAIVLVPQGSWGLRIYNTFKEAWEQFGGQLMEAQKYPPDANDFSEPLQRLLSIDESRNRLRALRQTLGLKLKFEPRRRQDIDFIFIAALPHQARQIRPQLKFFYAADLPIYATSHIYTGTPNPKADKDMDDIMFTDMPWVLAPGAEGNQLWQSINTQWPKTANTFKRLYALGIDSFNIIPHLRRLSGFQFQQFKGQTGKLNLNHIRQVERQLIWARFAQGTPELLEDNLFFK